MHSFPLPLVRSIISLFICLQKSCCARLTCSSRFLLSRRRKRNTKLVDIKLAEIVLAQNWMATGILFRNKTKVTFILPWSWRKSTRYSNPPRRRGSRKSFESAVIARKNKRRRCFVSKCLKKGEISLRNESMERNARIF